MKPVPSLPRALAVLGIRSVVVNIDFHAADSDTGLGTHQRFRAQFRTIRLVYCGELLGGVIPPQSQERAVN